MRSGNSTPSRCAPDRPEERKGSHGYGEGSWSIGSSQPSSAKLPGSWPQWRMSFQRAATATVVSRRVTENLEVRSPSPTAGAQQRERWVRGFSSSPHPPLKLLARERITFSAPSRSRLVNHGPYFLKPH